MKGSGKGQWEGTRVSPKIKYYIFFIILIFKKLYENVFKIQIYKNIFSKYTLLSHKRKILELLCAWGGTMDPNKSESNCYATQKF